MSSLLADRVIAARHENFVGRAQERALFYDTITAETLPFNVLFLWGPGGIGKTTLLREYAEICKQVGHSTVYLDARNIDPTPVAFLNALQHALGIPQKTPAIEFLSSLSSRSIISVDTYEVLGPLDEWMFQNFMAQLPENILFILAGRQPPSTVWRTDPGWRALIHVLALRNLTPEESNTYLRKRAIPESQYQSVLDFTHGHPMALSLVADVFAQRGKMGDLPAATPNIVKTLIDQLVQKVPGPAHRTALEACALVRVTTESLLATMLANPDVHDLFEWLRGLSIIESRPGGLFPHDLVREALVADLRWRNPDWYTELKRRARTFYTDRIASTSGQTQQRNLLDLVYLHRDNALVRPYFEWQTSGSALVDAFQESDLKPLIKMVSIHEGERSAEFARYWLVRQPDEVLVMRGINSDPMGFLMILDLEQARQNNDLYDPAVIAASNYLTQNAPLRSGERTTLFRFWMAADTYQDVSPIQSLISIHIVRHCLTTPGLAFAFIPCAQGDFWAPAFAYADLARLPEADFEVGGFPYQVYGHDWRVRPPGAWLALLAERETSISPQLIGQPPETEEQLVVLSRETFSDAVRAVLRSYSSLDQIQDNPLLRSRLVVPKTGGEKNRDQRIKILGDLVLQAAETLKSSPRSEKLFKALDKTYFHPAPTQEIASELLGLPFSTYRRHLRSGIEQVIEILWKQEIGY